jgi:predicted glutamine amidotransferase
MPGLPPASVPLSADLAWRALEEGELLVLRAGCLLAE